MHRPSLSPLVLPIVLGALLAGACGGGTSSTPAGDFRGDALCATASVVSQGSSCQLSVTMHGHTYVLNCDLSQHDCQCLRDGRPSGSSAFGGSATPMCTLADRDFEWSDCCGTPQ